MSFVSLPMSVAPLVLASVLFTSALVQSTLGQLTARTVTSVLPGEFALQDAILVSTHLCRYSVYEDLASAILNSGMKLIVASSNGQLPNNCKVQGFTQASGLVAIEADSSSEWIRDYGPFVTTTSDGRFRIYNFHYPRGYNQRYEDNAFPGAVTDPLCAIDPRYCGAYEGDTFRRVLLEGGNFLPNGKGLCLVSDAILCQTGESSYCRQNEASYAMSPPYGKSMNWIRQQVATELGCTDLRVLGGYYGDEGLNHVDMFMTFASANDLILGSFDDTDPRNKAIYESNKALLDDLTMANPPLNIHTVPMPSQCSSGNSCSNSPYRTLRTFLNGLFLPGTKQYVMPTYSVSGNTYTAQERDAIDKFESLGWDVLKLPGDELIALNGVFHCVTRNLPSYVPQPTPTPPPQCTAIDTARPWTNQKCQDKCADVTSCHGGCDKKCSSCTCNAAPTPAPPAPPPTAQCTAIDQAKAWTDQACLDRCTDLTTCHRKCDNKCSSCGCNVAPTPAPPPPSECIAIAPRWTDNQCKKKCNKASNCHKTCNKRCSDSCACNSGRLLSAFEFV